MKTVLVHERPTSGAKQSRPAQRRPTSRPAWAAGAPLTGRPPPSAGSRSCCVAFAVGGQVGTKQADPNTAGPGESGRMDRILDAGFKQPAGESVLIQSRSLRAGDSCLRRRRRGRRRRASRRWRPCRTSARRSIRPTRARSRTDGHAALVEFEIRGDKHQGGRQARPGPRERRRRAARPSRLLHRRVRRCERGQGGRHRLRATTWQERGRALAPDHADHPRASRSARSWRRASRCCSR